MDFACSSPLDWISIKLTINIENRNESIVVIEYRDSHQTRLLEWRVDKRYFLYAFFDFFPYMAKGMDQIYIGIQQ